MKSTENISSNFFQKLKGAVASILSNSLSLSQENFLLQTAHALAANILRIKFSKNPIIKNYLGLTEHDLGFDCIAELFERDSNRTLLHLKTYFSNFNLNELSEKEILFHYRRLVSSAVNQNLMHVYRDFDPSLGKILRNIKLSVAAHKAFEEIDWFDELCLVPIHCPPNEHLPAVTQEELFDLLSCNVKGNEFIPELLSVLSRVIREQHNFRRIIPLVTVALTFRMLLLVKQYPESEVEFSGKEFEVKELIQKNIELVKCSILGHNHHENATVALIGVYFQTIQNVLLTKINVAENPTDSLFSGLQLFIEELDSQKYQQCHRTKLEYYYKLCREAIAADLLERKTKT